MRRKTFGLSDNNSLIGIINIFQILIYNHAYSISDTTHMSVKKIHIYDPYYS